MYYRGKSELIINNLEIFSLYEVLYIPSYLLFSLIAIFINCKKIMNQFYLQNDKSLSPLQKITI